MKDTMRLKCDAVWANQTWWMWTRWTLICKINEMEMNGEMNELDFGIWNEWDESDYANM